MTTLIIVIAIPVIAFVAGYFYFVHASLSLWINAMIAGASVRLFDIAFLRLEKVKHEDIKNMVDRIVVASKAGIHIDTSTIGHHLLAGGDVNRVIQAMIESSKANIPLTVGQASAIEIAGRDVLETVRMSINPETLETPEISAMARDGIQLKARCSVTVKANPERFLGGVGTETILARVGTGIVSAIGSADNHQDIMENPSAIPDYIMAIDRDGDDVSDIHQDAAFIVISIDVADVNVGRNLKAVLQAERAEADAKRANADAEKDRANAVTHAEHMKARVHEMHVKRLEAQAEVPKAIAEAIRSGKLTIKNYYKMKNLDADTRMREAFAVLGKRKE